MNVLILVGALLFGLVTILNFFSRRSRLTAQTWLDGVQSAELDIELHGLSGAHHSAVVNGYTNDESAFCHGYLDLLSHTASRHSQPTKHGDTR